MILYDAARPGARLNRPFAFFQNLAYLALSTSTGSNYMLVLHPLFSSRCNYSHHIDRCEPLQLHSKTSKTNQLEILRKLRGCVIAMQVFRQIFCRKNKSKT